MLRKNIRTIILFNPFKILIVLLFFSCVYYNTFYNAEVNFKKAKKIIEQTPSSSNSENEEIPSQAKKLLGQAIENCHIVINSYPNSKYVDDAYFIIGKASFLRKEFFNSEKYLNKLIEFYPNSDYYNEAQIWLVYTYLKMDRLELVKSELEKLETLDNKEHLFLINNIFAEISMK